VSRPEAWLLSAYHTDSHASWADWLTSHLRDIDWQTFELPGRHFRWRIRGNPLSWLDTLPADGPDLLIATSMVDLATLRGLRPALANTPCLYYFHENQFAYPRSRAQHSSVDPQMVQLYGALAATRIAFNSSYNRDSFLKGIKALGKKLPDHFPEGLDRRVSEKSQVLGVPIQPVAPGNKNPRLILWNHRWEYDKAPELFAEAVAQLRRARVDFRLALLGARTPKPHPALQRIRSLVPPEHIVADGHLPGPAYRQLLGQAGIVVSTAIHEFQGISVLEAVSAGATPLAPKHLCYPQQYPAEYLYPPGDADALAQRLGDWIEQGIPTPPKTDAFHSEQLRTPWQAQINRLLD